MWRGFEKLVQLNHFSMIGWNTFTSNHQGKEKINENKEQEQGPCWALSCSGPYILYSFEANLEYNDKNGKEKKQMIEA